MKLITFATYKEAEASLTYFGASEIAITGMGPKATKDFLEKLDFTPSCIVNIGLAGALRPDLVEGTIYPIGRVSYNNNTLVLENEGLALATCDKPQYNSILGHSYDLVDMEGYVVAAYAKKNNIPCALYKLVSDFCTETTSQQIAANLPKFSEIIASFLHNRIPILCKDFSSFSYSWEPP